MPVRSVAPGRCASMKAVGATEPAGDAPAALMDAHQATRRGSADDRSGTFVRRAWSRLAGSCPANGRPGMRLWALPLPHEVGGALYGSRWRRYAVATPLRDPVRCVRSVRAGRLSPLAVSAAANGRSGCSVPGLVGRRQAAAFDRWSASRLCRTRGGDRTSGLGEVGMVVSIFPGTVQVRHAVKRLLNL